MPEKTPPDRRGRCIAIIGTVAAAICTSVGVLLARGNFLAQWETGEQFYKPACVACHGPDGTGTAQSISGFEPPRTFPDFTRCDQTTPEDNLAWKSVIVHGGPNRGLSQIM